MTQEITPELQARMVELVRRLAADEAYAVSARNGVIVRDSARDIRAIAAELPALVDPDLLIAREVARDTIGVCSSQFVDGRDDDTMGVILPLAAIKRIRQEGVKS